MGGDVIKQLRWHPRTLTIHLGVQGSGYNACCYADTMLQDVHQMLVLALEPQPTMIKANICHYNLHPSHEHIKQALGVTDLDQLE